LWFPKDGKREPGRLGQSWSDTSTEDLQNIRMTWTDYEEIDKTRQCGKAVANRPFDDLIDELPGKNDI